VAEAFPDAAEPFPVPLTLAQAAERFGAYRWAEQRLFELTGAWAAEATSPEARIHLDVVSGQHAWHAELWAARLPVLDGTDREALTRPAGPVLGPLLDEVARTSGTVARLAALYRVVVPRLLTTYGRHLRRAAPATDAPAVRALRLVRRDEVESWEAGEALLEHLVVGAGDAAAAAAVQARLEAGLVASWAGWGLLPWPQEAPGSAPSGAAEGPPGHDT
jgi:hypothetical protein